MNTVHLIGRVGGEPEVKYFESGSIKAEFTLAVERKKKNDEPDWFNIQAWGKTAEIIESYVRKGKQVGIEGSLKIETWEDKKTGTSRSKPVISVDRLVLLGSKNDDGKDESKLVAVGAKELATSNIGMDDIPF